MEPTPGLRPLTVRERVRTWGMGAVPSSFLYIALKAVTYLLEDSDLPLWAYLVGPTSTVNLPLPLGEGGGIDLQLIFYLLSVPVILCSSLLYLGPGLRPPAGGGLRR